MALQGAAPVAVRTPNGRQPRSENHRHHPPLLIRLKENSALSIKEPSFGLLLSTLLLKFAENSVAMLQSGEKYINPLTDFKTAEISQLTTEDLRAYELSVNAYRDIKNGIDAAKKEGMEKGIAIGTKNKAVAIARNMAHEGIPCATISKVTGLTVKEIGGLV